MNEERLTNKQVYILVIAIVVGIAFFETSAGPIWSTEFLREFFLKVLVYGVVVEFVVILLVSFLGKGQE